MTRRPVVAATALVVVLASGVGGWLIWMGRSPFGRAATGPPAGGVAPQTASTTAPDTTGGARLLWTLAGHTADAAAGQCPATRQTKVRQPDHEAV